MPIAQAATKVIANRLPKVIDARAHAVLDYLTAGAFLALGAIFWRRNQRAAIGALACGGAVLATAMVTDYPGGLRPVISFPMHGRIDAGLAAFTAAAPTFLAFANEEEAKYFSGMALVETVVTGLTDFDARGKVLEMPLRDRAAG